ncbi:MAG TPA: toll/interleukin-1 receptor domain-containing protein [Thermoanaerobaculia bacterium]|nr:toll/interleukin-1 receptor domain-containing protein [Thermoanaerobaculia bacterium]
MSPNSWFNRPYDGPYKKPKSKPSVKVFISYSHRDSEVANALRQRLTAQGLSVVIDSGALRPGKSIQKFIEESVRATDATVSIVSKYSLLSAWVALESEEVLRRQRKSFFGCYLDEEFLRPGFVDDALDYADLKMRDIGENIKKRIDKGRSFEDLYGDLERYRLLGSSIDKVVGRLRESACLSLQPDDFSESVEKLVQALRNLNG